MRITVVTPTYNEAENLPKLVSALFSLPLDINLLVVDDNSPDGTGRIADELVVKYPGRVDVLHRPGKMGLRSAYLNGFQKVMDSSVDAIVQMDADFSHDPSALLDMANLLTDNDIVLGSRYVKGGSVDERWPLWRRSLSAFGNYYARTILGLPLHDVTTGYRMWRRETLQQVPFERIHSSGYVFLVEMAYLAHCLEFKIGEAPIYFADRRWGKSKMSIKIQLEAAIRIWQVWWNYRDLKKAGKAGRL
ncbi:MAG TPA: polyprenol monophosphomannose synthase [Anaerolineales bacterium]|nr:polyprenol monophosphomannose synthase [Anaerolineales bacterium]HMV96217.1 polyprenol monophosphomannose synthase [Anaerolineales bacterium]HMX17619.1 polyprenol monophosphomannose synthase [Anaerolineales bacterium]HMX73133.1 polyprenol monophosphomannose synthase [Anaerolineales bacterium]HMZ41994.1 polyprenol monophosphomannose synthase [Anaerolineales bacterium]